ncbi:MAG: sigma-70 family RNA polymerase sigma factor [Dermatophilaceae bacterium]
MPPPATLTELVSRASAGDQGAWDEIVGRFSALLWSVARSYRLEPNVAGDVVQGTWLRLVESLDRINEPEALPGWLLTTCRREAIRVVRARGREVLSYDGDEADDEPDDAPPPDTALLTDERDAALWAAFRRLGERCQRLLRVLMAPECPPYAVVAVELGMPVGSIGPTRMRCLTRLRGLLGDTGYDFGTAREGSLP